MRLKYGNIRQRNAGFTLLELLVALLIFAVLAVMAYGGLQVVLDAQKRTAVQAMRLGELQVFFAILGRDVEQMIDRPIRNSYGDEEAALIGASGTLEFTRTGWRNPAGFARSNMQRVAYVLDDDRIIRYGWQVLDRSPESTAIEKVLLEKVNEIDVRYLDQQLQWQTQWPAVSVNSAVVPGLPRAVEITVDVEGWGRITRLFSLAAGFPAASAKQASQTKSAGATP